MTQQYHRRCWRPVASKGTRGDAKSSRKSSGGEGSAKI